VGVIGVSTRDAQAIQELKSAIADGKNWYVAVLEAIRFWRSAGEDHAGRHYQYLIDNEAFDWMALTERLCEELNGLVPEEERTNLLFFGVPPIELSRDEFKSIIGDFKYQAHLNYFYGIIVERFLILAVIEEMRKKKRALCLYNDSGVVEETYQRIYGATQFALLKQFRKERHYPQPKSISLSELNEFTYWLFKYRIKMRDKSRVASDTKKALTKLHGLLKLEAKSRASHFSTANNSYLSADDERN
jgi:hypothetical protein